MIGIRVSLGNCLEEISDVEVTPCMYAAYILKTRLSYISLPPSEKESGG